MKKFVIANAADQGSTIVLAALAVFIAMAASLVFFSKARDFLSIVNSRVDAIDAQFQLEGALEQARADIDTAMKEVRLDGRMKFANPGTALTSGGERFDVINNLYATDTNSNGSALDEASNFLKHVLVARSYNSAGVQTTGHPYTSFESAFPSDWFDPDESDDEYYQIKFTFNPLRVESQITSNPKRILFEYEYRIDVRSYGRSKFSERKAEDSGVIAIEVRGAPFSRWALFADSMLNQNGSTLYFAGGNTAAQAQEVYGGPVHINQRPNFYGHPIFKGLFTSGVAESLWNYVSAPNYTGCPSQCPVFEQGKIGSYPTSALPSSIFNTHRLAAGDTSPTASTNNSQPTLAEMKNFLAYHADGILDQGVSAIPNGTYLPVNNLGALEPTGGIYVQGDAEIVMNVVQGETDFDASVWNQIQASHRTCKFQQLKITALSASNQVRDIYIADDPCHVTYVFDGASYSTAPKVLSGRINGNIHVDGKINKLGGISRTRPAVAQDFALTISAVKDVNIVNDIQYEDAVYVTTDASGTVGTTIVANPYGAVGGSGIDPTNANISAKISDDSQTVLGIISTQRNVYVFTSSPYNASTSAPDNINLHAAIFAGNNAHFNSSTGLGCGSNTAAKRGCGFGVANYATAPNKGTIKFFGGISEFKDQTTGQISGSTLRGYSSRYYYDQRLLNHISPPAFPISDAPEAYGTVKRIKSFRMAKNP